MKEYIVYFTNCGENAFVIAQDKIGLIFGDLPAGSQELVERLNALYMAQTTSVYSIALESLTGLVCG